MPPRSGISEIDQTFKSGSLLAARVIRPEPSVGVNRTNFFHRRRKAVSRAALHCEETTRVAVLRHPRMLL